MPRKRGNGEGSIYNNGKYWVGQVTTSTDPETGKLKRKTIYGKTKREVQEKVTAMLNQINIGTYVEPSKMTMKEWFEYWYNNFKKNQLSDTTQARYYFNLKNHIYKPFGAIRLKDLSTFMIQKYMNDLYESGKSTDTIKRIYTLIREAMRHAMKLDLLVKNPCEGVVLPRAKQKHPPKALTRQEQQKLVAYCSKKDGDLLFLFLLGTGLRIGEALGLSWDSVSFEENSLQIEQIAYELRGVAKLKNTTKTLSGYRKVPMSPKIVDLLIRVVSNQDNQKNKYNLVFPSKNYNIKSSANVRHKFDMTCKYAGIERMNIHSLRHTFATRMLEAGVNIKVLSEILGHKKIQITLDTYAHVLPDTKKENMDKIDEFL